MGGLCEERSDKGKGGEENWREKANNRDQWKQITKVAVLRSRLTHKQAKNKNKPIFLEL